MTEKNIDAVPERKQQQMLAVRVSIAGSITLFLIAAIVGIAVDSITLLLDASANLVILIGAFLMNYAINKIHRPADETFNFGYGKYEPLIATIQGLLIFATCALAIKFAVQDIVHAEAVTNHVIPVVATFASSIIGVFITIYLRRLARRTGSSMLHASGLHWYMDTMLSFTICFGFILGLALQLTGHLKITPYVDPVMAIILAVVLIGAPAKTVIHNVLELLDAAPKGNVSGRVKEVLDARKPESLGVRRIRTRKAGEKIFLEVTLTANDDLTVAESEKLADRIEKDITSDIGNCDVVVCFKSNNAGSGDGPKSATP